MSLAESWMPDTNPRMLSRNISISTAAEAPRLVSSSVGDLSIRIEMTRMAQISAAMPCAVCRSPLIGLVLPRGARRDDAEHGVEQGVDEEEDRDDDADLGQTQHEGVRSRHVVEDRRQDRREQCGGEDVAAVAQHRRAEEFVVPRRTRAQHQLPHPRTATVRHSQSNSSAAATATRHATQRSQWSCAAGSPQPVEQPVRRPFQNRPHTTDAFNYCAERGARPKIPVALFSKLG